MKTGISTLPGIDIHLREDASGLQSEMKTGWYSFLCRHEVIFFAFLGFEGENARHEKDETEHLQLSQLPHVPGSQAG